MARERCRFRAWCMNLPIEAPSDALPKSMAQEVQTIRRWDGLEPVAGATGGLERGRSGGGRWRVRRGRRKGIEGKVGAEGHR